MPLTYMLPKPGVESPVEQRHPVAAGQPGADRLHLPPGRPRESGRDVVRDGSFEEVDLLGDHPDAPAQGGRVDVPQLDPGEPDVTAIVAERPQEQLEQGGLAGARRPDDGDPLPRFDRQGHVAELVVGRTGVPERHVVHLDPAPQVPGARRSR